MAGEFHHDLGRGGVAVVLNSFGDEACKVSANLDAAGALSASLVEEAIADAVYAAKNGS